MTEKEELIDETVQAPAKGAAEAVEAPSQYGQGASLNDRLRDFFGKVPVASAFPYGVQHVLALFVANLAPITIICAAAGFDAGMTATLIQNALIVAGIGTLVQLYGIWRVGARLPIVMGVSFTFVTVLCGIAAKYGYPTAVGAVIAGGLIEGTLGLFAKYWRRFITPVVSAVVVTSIGFSLLGTGAQTFAGGAGAPDFASLTNLALGLVSLVACLVFQCFSKGFAKQLSVLFGLGVGYALALCLGKVDFSGFAGISPVALPHIMPFMPEFNAGAIVTVVLLYLVSMAETLGDSAVVSSLTFGRNPSERELSGAVAADGFTSVLAGCFGCSPLTSFAQNIGLIAMTKVVNRRAIACGAGILILAGFVPAVGEAFGSVPSAVLGGCTIMMFGMICVSGLQMIARAGFTQRNMTIVAISLAVGIGFSQVADVFVNFPELLQNMLVDNSIALTFITALVLSALLPREGEDANEGRQLKEADPEAEAA